MAQTYIVYIGLLVLGAFFAYRYDSTRHMRWVVAIVILLSFVAGFRGENVGCDTGNYYLRFEYILCGKGYWAVGFEESFKKIVSVLGLIMPSATFVIVVFSCLIYGLIFFRLKDFSEQISMLWAYFAFYATFYFMSLNIMRQFCAVAVVFFATRYIAQKKYSLFVLLLLVAVCFHTSALLGFLFILINLLFLNYDTIKRKILLMFGSVLGTGFFLFLFSYVAKYEHYFGSDESTKPGFLLVVKLVLFLTITFFYFFEYKIGKFQYSKYSVKFPFVAYLVGIFLTSLGYFFPYMDRIGLYFYMFEPVFVGAIMKGRMPSFDAYVFGLLFIALFFFVFITGLQGGGQCQIPYFFAWERV